MSDPESLEASLRELNWRLIAVQDQERRRIARDMHDSLGQMIVLMKLNLDSISKLAKLCPEQAELLAQTEVLADRMAIELRTTCYLLHPPLLDEVGLVAALRGLVDGFSERSGIKASLQIDDKFARLPADVEISLYRIIQESLTNIHRHSGSPTARICIERRPAEIHIEIQDDGKGIPVEKITNGSGVGLGGMRQRATQLRGTLEIKSNGNGTTVLARLPLERGGEVGRALEETGSLPRKN